MLLCACALLRTHGDGGLPDVPGLAEQDGTGQRCSRPRTARFMSGSRATAAMATLSTSIQRPIGMVDVGDLNKLTGQAGLAIGPQSKIHAKFGEGKDGRIYFATHGGLWFDYSRYATPEGYPGAHYMAYDPRTGMVQDFGIGPRYEGMNTAHLTRSTTAFTGLHPPRTLCLLRRGYWRKGG